MIQLKINNMDHKAISLNYLYSLLGEMINKKGGAIYIAPLK